MRQRFTRFLHAPRKKYATPPLTLSTDPSHPGPRNILIEPIFVLSKKVTFRKRANSFRFSHVEIRSSVSEYSLSSRFHSRIGARFHAMGREWWKDTEFEKSLERSRREEERVEKNGRGP